MKHTCTINADDDKMTKNQYYQILPPAQEIIWEKEHKNQRWHQV